MNVTKETITPKKAMEWLKRNVNNRPLSQVTINHYAATMAAGAWKLNGDCIRFNGNGDLIDGQHRLNACVHAAKPFESYVVRGLEHDAFDTIDQGKKRTIGDVYARQGYKNYNALASSCRWMWMYESGFLGGGPGGKRAFRPDIANDILERHPGIHHAVEISCGYRRKQKLIHPGLLGFLFYVTSSRDEAKAQKFWDAVITAEGLTRSSPAYALHSRLVNNLGATAKLSIRTISALCIKAWNAYRSGRPLGTLKWAENEDFPKIS